MKNFRKMFILAVAAMSFAACNKNDDYAPGMVAAVLKDGNAEYWKQVSTGIVNQIPYGLGVFMSWTDDDGDAAEQIENIDTLGKIKNVVPVGLILAPINRDVESAAAAYAAKKGVSVVVIDTPIDLETSPLKNYYRCFVGTDNAQAGKDFADSIKVDASSIVCFRLESSQPAKMRFDAFAAKKGDVDDVCVTMKNVKEKVDSVRSANPSASAYVFFNGDICNEVLDSLGDKDVYTFDVYKKLLESLRDGGCVKGIMAQDTFTMGAIAVRAFFSDASGEYYLDPLYFNSNSLNNASFMKFLSYYGL